MNGHESYVSVEIAKLLKELKFDWEGKLCLDDKFYPGSEIKRWNNMDNVKSPENLTVVPTLNIAQKWLRDVQGVDITVSFCKHEFEAGVGIEKAYFNECEKITKDGVIDYTDNEAYFHTYEEALENGIEVAVNALVEEIDKQ